MEQGRRRIFGLGYSPGAGHTHVCAIRDIEMRHPNPASTPAPAGRILCQEAATPTVTTETTTTGGRSSSSTTRGQAAICPCDGVAAGDKVGGHDTSA